LYLLAVIVEQGKQVILMNRKSAKNPRGKQRTPWDSGGSWRPLEALGGPWRPMEALGGLWSSMEPFQIPRNHDEVSQSPMKLIEIPWNHVKVSRTPTESHGTHGNPLESLWSLSESQRVPRSPIEPIEIPWNHVEVSRSPVKSHPWSPSESHGTHWNPLESRWSLSEIYGVSRNPIESHGILWNPMQLLWSLSEPPGSPWNFLGIT